MRKICCLILLTAALFSHSCVAGKKVAYDFIYDEYHFFGTCEYADTEYRGEFYISEGQQLCQRERRIILSYPESMESVEIYSVREQAVIKRGEVSVNIDENNNGLLQIFKLFDIEKGASVKKSENELEVFSDDSKYTIKFENGRVKSISRQTEGEEMSIHIGELYE